MAPLLVAKTLFPMYELEAHNAGIISYSKEPVTTVPQLKSPEFFHKLWSSSGKPIKDAIKRASRHSRRTSHPLSPTDANSLVGEYEKLYFLNRCAIDDGITSNNLPLPVNLDTRESRSTTGKISAMARDHIRAWQDCRKGRIRELLTKGQRTKPYEPLEAPEASKTYRQNTPSGCSCGPPGCCTLERLAKEDRNNKAAEESDIAAAEQMANNNGNSRQIVSILGKTQHLIGRRSSKQRNKDKGKGKEVDTAQNSDTDVWYHPSPPDQPGDEDEAPPTTSRRIPWRPEFQAKPPPSCNCLLFKTNHRFSDGEIQKMRWFLDRIARELAAPDDWFKDETQFAAQRESRRWNVLNPLRPQSLASPPMSLLNKNWIMVHRAPVSTNQSLLLSQGHFANSSIHPTPLTTMKQPCRQSSLIGPQLQSSGSISSAACRIPDSRSKDGIWTSICDLPKANDAPVTLKEYIAASKLASKPQFKRPSLQVDTSVHEDDKSRITPNNTPQTATNQSKAISVVEGVSISSVYLDVADLNPDIGKSEDSRQPENESFNGIHTDEIQA